MSTSAIENCRFCLMCRHAAPVGHVMHNESVTPHGIALVVASQRRRLLDWNPSSIDVLYAEPDSGNCRAHCVTDQRLPAGIAAVRAELCSAGLAPQSVYAIHEKLKLTGSAFGEHVHASGAADTALFVGDEAHNLWPDSAASARSLLRACGTEAVPVGMGASPGYMACSLGFPDTAREHARTCIDEVRATGARKLLVLSPGDLFTFRQLYPERLSISWPSDIELIDLATFLAEQLASGTLRLHTGQGDAAYVDPTHAVRTQERFGPVRALCNAVLGQAPRELFWRKERAHPVGSTALQFSRPDIAEALTRARIEDAKAAQAASVLCEDPGTLYHLERYAPEYDLQVQGLFEALAALARA